MKTIKIIDLMIKIANGEEVPKKIKYYDTLYVYEDKNKDYFCGDKDEYYTDALLFPYTISPKEFLNYVVEIVEDKPEEIIANALNYIEEHKSTNPHLTLLLVDSEIEELEKILKGE